MKYEGMLKELSEERDDAWNRVLMRLRVAGVELIEGDPLYIELESWRDLEVEIINKIRDHDG